MSDGIASGGQGGAGMISGTPKAADNTGRDWGQGIGLGVATAGSIIGSILTFGAATPALATLDAASIGATAANDAVQDKAQGQQQLKAQQAQLDSAQAARPTGPAVQMGNPLGNANFQSSKIGSGANLKAAAQPMAPPSVGSIQAKPNDFSGFASPPQVEQAPIAQNNPDFQITSDRRAKKNVASGNLAAADFLDAVRRRSAWPKGIKDPAT